MIITPEIITRVFSNDQMYFDKVFFGNEYQLRGVKDAPIRPTVVDIGAHAGFFTFTALTLGAKKVYCFEPSIDNFDILLKNCRTSNVTPYQLGVYTSPTIGRFSSPQLVNGIYLDFGSVGLALEDEKTSYPCSCVTLSTILKEYCFNEQIDILKINIGYAEREILQGADSTLENNVVSICGQVTCNEQEFLAFKKTMSIRGFVNCLSKPQDENGRVVFWMSQVSLSENFVE